MRAGATYEYRTRAFPRPGSGTVTGGDLVRFTAGATLPDGTVGVRFADGATAHINRRSPMYLGAVEVAT